MIPNKQLDDGCPCDVCSSRDEISKAEPIDELRFQNAVLDWFITINDKLDEIKKEIKV